MQVQLDNNNNQQPLGQIINNDTNTPKSSPQTNTAIWQLTAALLPLFPPQLTHAHTLDPLTAPLCCCCLLRAWQLQHVSLWSWMG